LGILVYQIFFRKKKENKPQNEKNYGKKNQKGYKGMNEDVRLNKYDETIKKLSSKTKDLTKSLENMKLDTGKISELESSLNSLKKSI